jgi:hypothetical protein
MTINPRLRRTNPNASDLAEPSTYFDKAASARSLAGEEAQPSIVGSAHGYPRIGSGPWSASSPNPPEPPLGEDVGSMTFGVDVSGRSAPPVDPIQQAHRAEDVVAPVAPSSANSSRRGL